MVVSKVVKGNRPPVLWQCVCWQFYWMYSLLSWKQQDLWCVQTSKWWEIPTSRSDPLCHPDAFFLVLRNNIAILKPKMSLLKHITWSCLDFGTCFHFLMRMSTLLLDIGSLKFLSPLPIIKTQLEGLGKNVCSDLRNLDHLWGHLCFLKA